MYKTFFSKKSKIILLVFVNLALEVLLGGQYYAVAKIDREAIKDVFATNRTLETKMILKVLERDFKNDQEIEYKIFEDGIVSKSVVYDGNVSTTSLFNTKIARISSTKLKTAKDFVNELRQTKFANTFPWFENLKDKGDVVQIEFASIHKLDCFNQKTLQDEKISKDCPEILLPATFIYYTNHPDSPKVFREVLKFVKML